MLSHFQGDTCQPTATAHPQGKRPRPAGPAVLSVPGAGQLVTAHSAPPAPPGHCTLKVQVSPRGRTQKRVSLPDRIPVPPPSKTAEPRNKDSWEFAGVGGSVSVQWPPGSSHECSESRLTLSLPVPGPRNPGSAPTAPGDTSPGTRTHHGRFLGPCHRSHTVTLSGTCCDTPPWAPKESGRSAPPSSPCSRASSPQGSCPASTTQACPAPHPGTWTPPRHRLSLRLPEPS